MFESLSLSLSFMFVWFVSHHWEGYLFVCEREREGEGGVSEREKSQCWTSVVSIISQKKKKEKEREGERTRRQEWAEEANQQQYSLLLKEGEKKRSKAIIVWHTTVQKIIRKFRTYRSLNLSHCRFCEITWNIEKELWGVCEIFGGKKMRERDRKKFIR